MSDMCLAGKSKKKRKIVNYYPLFYVFRGRKTQNNQKKLFFNYFLLYLVATIVIIALYTKNNILIFRCQIYRICLEIVS